MFIGLNTIFYTKKDVPNPVLKFLSFVLLEGPRNVQMKRE